MVNITDFAILAAQWIDLPCDASNEWCQGADYDQSGMVDGLDLAKMAEWWLN
jgi:hypothetical protein